MTKTTRTMDDDRAFLRELFDENPLLTPDEMNAAYAQWREDQPPLETSAPPAPKPKNEDSDDGPEQADDKAAVEAEDPRDTYWPSYLGGTMPEGYTPTHKLKEPDIKVPSRHDLDADGIAKVVSEYQQAFCQINGLSTNDYSAQQAVARFRKAVNSQSRPILEQIERIEAKEAAAAKEKSDRLDAATKQRRDAAQAEIERIKNLKRRSWLENGGTEEGFTAYWSTHGEAEVVTERMRQDEARVARPGRSY